MLPFRVQIRPGISIYEQVVYAAKKAIVAGQIHPGDPFPSVRALSRELKMNPNTAHKIISNLVTSGLLEIRPGIGAVVSTLPESTKTARTELLENEIEQLVVEAKRLGIEAGQVLTSVSAHWKKLSNENSSDRGGRTKP